MYTCLFRNSNCRHLLSHDYYEIQIVDIICTHEYAEIQIVDILCTHDYVEIQIVDILCTHVHTYSLSKPNLT
jgi:hypothetical protein